MRLNKIFTDGVILQANKTVRIFGTGRGTATLELDGVVVTESFDTNDWVVELPEHEYGGPYTMTAKLNRDVIIVEDVYFGDVYLIAGQSNMDLRMAETNYPEEKYQTNEGVRLFTVCFSKREFDEDYGWLKCNSETVSKWNAIGYHIGIELNEKTNRKIGIVSCCQGAAMIQSFLPRGFFADEKFATVREPVAVPDRVQQYLYFNLDGTIYRNMFSKIIPFSFKAVAWYQGESNASPSNAPYYEEMLSMFIEKWRIDLLDEGLPFVIIQIADYFERDITAWSLVQDSQKRVCEKMHDTYLVVSRDVCESDNIHPPTKDKLSHRVASVLEKI